MTDKPEQRPTDATGTTAGITAGVPASTATPGPVSVAPEGPPAPQPPPAPQAPPAPPLIDPGPVAKLTASQAPRSARSRIEPETPPVRPEHKRTRAEKKDARRRRRGASSQEIVAFGSGFFSLLMLIGLAGVIVFGMARQAFVAPGPLREETIVLIPRGSSLEQTAESLAARGVIRDAQLFTFGTALSNQRGAMKAGEYQFPPNASMQQVLDIITSGRVVQHSVTIPEGLTSFQVVQRLRENELLSGEIREIPPEGALLPETYLVPRGYPRSEIIRRMTQDQQRVLTEIWNRRRADVPVRTPQELVTLASIIEKETGKADERPRVAAVFVNRLNRRMRLQSDPTIIYGIVGGQGSLGRPILRSEIERPTPYNTYVIPALPPGPIANPGRAALEAAANPMRTNELYFVADGTGGHTFSETLEQHNRAVARWRDIERSRGGQVSPGLDTAPASADQPQRPARPAAPARPPSSGAAAPPSQPQAFR